MSALSQLQSRRAETRQTPATSSTIPPASLLRCQHLQEVYPTRTLSKMASTDLSPVTLLQQEIQSLTSSMRRNQRWASTSSASFASSAAPLPPSLHQARLARRDGLSTKKRGRGSTDGADEGDLMIGFIELKRSLTGLKGRSSWVHASRVV